MSIPATLDPALLGGVQSRFNLAYLVFNLATLAVLRLRPALFRPAAVLFLLVSYLYVTAAQFLVVEDQLRMLLYFPLTGVAFLVLGSVYGWITVAAALAAFAATVVRGMIEVSPLAVSTFVLTLCVTAVFFQVFRRQTGRAMETVIAQNRVLDTAARRDPLTGVLNRRGFHEALEAIAADPAGGRYCVAFVDIDHFKAINDRYGHAAGDAALVAVADFLAAALRDEDVLARIGGEEFAVILPRTDLRGAVAAAERLRAGIRGLPIAALPDGVRITASVGVASSETVAGSVNAVLHAADAAMYEAKRTGRDRVVADRAPAPAAT